MNNSDTKKALKDYLQNQKIDIKLETLLANFISNQHQLLDDVLINSLGNFERNYRKDIGEIKESDNRAILNIPIHREGIYDYLPYSYFHTALPKEPTNRYQSHLYHHEKSIALIAQQKLEEQHARVFFSPIEQLFFEKKIANAWLEKQFESLTESSESFFFWMDFWAIPDFFDTKEVINLLYMLPLIHKINGNYEVLSSVYSTILATPVTVRSIVVNREISIELIGTQDVKMSCMGDYQLGENSILESQTYQETLPIMIIDIGPIPIEQLDDFKTGKKAQQLTYLEKTFLPVEFDAEIRFSFDAIDSFELGTEYILLGYNSIITP